MYEAIRERASSSSQLTGGVVTAVSLAIAAHVMMAGLGARFAPPAAPRTTVATLPLEPDTTPRDPAERIAPDSDTPLPAPTPVPYDPPLYFPDNVTRIATSSEPAPSAGLSAPTAPPVRLAPRLLPADPPPYPPAEIRARGEGATGLEICVDRRGRVTDAKIVSSSSRDRLDQAALRWVRMARFTPGAVGGVPQAMCGHSVVYEWRLETARR